MKTKLFIFLLFAIYESSEAFAFYKPNASQPDSTEAELYTIKRWTCAEHLSLWRGFFDCTDIAFRTNGHLFRDGAVIIGLQEMRKSLGVLPSPSPKSSYNETKASEEDLQLATTIEAYYNLQEQQHVSFMNTDWTNFVDRMYPLAVVYLDKRAPQIRTVFKRKFEDLRQLKSKVVDRDDVDGIIEEFKNVKNTVKQILEKKMKPLRWCRDYIDPYLSTSSSDNFTFLPTESMMLSPNRIPKTIKAITVSEPFNVTFELDKFTSITNEDVEMLWGDIFTARGALVNTKWHASRGAFAIGLQELRTSLGLPPNHPYMVYDTDEPTEEDLKYALTMEDYLNMKKPIRNMFTNLEFLIPEPALAPLVTFLDYRSPEIRAVYKRQFEEMRQKDGEEVSRATVDAMIAEFYVIQSKVSKLITGW